MKTLSKDQVLSIMEDYENDPQQLIAILLDIQAASGKNYVDRQWAQLAADVLKIPLSKIFDTITFYAMLALEPRGEYIIEICSSAPCHFCGGREAVRWFEAAAGIKMGETTADGRITLSFTSCFGACGIAPAVKIGDDVFGSLTAEKAAELVQSCIQGRELRPLCQN